MKGTMVGVWLMVLVGQDCWDEDTACRSDAEATLTACTDPCRTAWAISIRPCTPQRLACQSLEDINKIAFCLTGPIPQAMGIFKVMPTFPFLAFLPTDGLPEYCRWVDLDEDGDVDMRDVATALVGRSAY